MKRIFPAIFLVISLVFCSCSGKHQNPKNPLGSAAFSCDTMISYANHSFTARLVYQNCANATLKITAPQQFSSLSFDLVNNELSARYGELTFPISSQSNPAISVAELIFSALNRAANSSDIKFESGTQEHYIDGEISGKRFRLSFDKSGSVPKRFTMSGIGFSAEFKNFQFL